MELLRRQVRVNYGFSLEHEGISCLESVITSRYRVRETIRTFQGSLLVGADGMFSAGRFHDHIQTLSLTLHLAVRSTHNLFVWPAVTYASTIVVTPEQYKSKFKKLLDESGATSLLIGDNRLALSTNSKSLGKVHMTLWYSRLTATAQDYHDFFGFQFDERDTPRVEYRFDEMIGQELDSLQPLPAPFATAYTLCKNTGVSQKWYLNAVRMRRSDLATEVFSDGLSMPAVLIGNAAHAIPEILSLADISWAIMDAMDLCHMIVERYDDDKLFSQITKDYYDIKYRQWRKLQLKWEENWTLAHGLPYDSGRAGGTWVKLQRTSRLPRPDTMPESEFKLLKNPDTRVIQQYKENELARWRKIRQRIRDRFERKNAFKLPSGAEPTKLVLRYLDSTALPEDNGEQETKKTMARRRRKFRVRRKKTKALATKSASQGPSSATLPVSVKPALGQDG